MTAPYRWDRQPSQGGSSASARAAARPRPARHAPPRAARLPGSYARFGRPCLRIVLFALVLPPALALALPIALLNALHFGPRRIFYSQARVGLRGEVFRILKFRTLHPGPGDEFESWRRGHDGARATRIGRFLRRTHLDELPQLVNIARGEMDFIGPRPEMVEIHRWASERVRGFDRRTALLPGVTGLAQVVQGYTGCEVAQYRRKLALDLFYLERRSLAMDLEILLRTVPWVWRARAAPARAVA